MIKNLLVSIMLCLVLIACETPTEPKVNVTNNISQSQPIYCLWTTGNSTNFKLLTAPTSIDGIVVDTIKVYRLDSSYMVEVFVRGSWQCQVTTKLNYAAK